MSVDLTDASPGAARHARVNGCSLSRAIAAYDAHLFMLVSPPSQANLS
jgi:hypothetical protein